MVDQTGFATAEGIDVARLVEQLRLAEARLARQRQSSTGLNDTDRAVIRFVLENSDSQREITPSAIATSLHLTPPAITAVIDRLAAGGFVTVAPHPTDRRKKIIQPFDRTLDPDHVDPLTTRIRALAARLAPADAAIVAAFLHDVLAAVGDPRLPAA